MTPTDLWTLSHSTSVLSKAKFGHHNFFSRRYPGVNIISRKASPALHQPHSDPTRFLRSVQKISGTQLSITHTVYNQSASLEPGDRSPSFSRAGRPRGTTLARMTQKERSSSLNSFSPKPRSSAQPTPHPASSLYAKEYSHG